MTQSAEIEAAADMFKALSSATRLSILVALDQPRTVTALVEATGVSQSLVSQHLRVLRGVDIVQVNRTGREAIYRITDAHVRHVIDDAILHAAEDHRA